MSYLSPWSGLGIGLSEKQPEADSFKCNRSNAAYCVDTFGCRELVPCGRTAVLVVSRYQKVPRTILYRYRQNGTAVPRY